MAGAATMVRGAVRLAVDFVLPPRCHGCGTIVAEQGTFCIDCWSGLDMLGPPCCARCGLPLPFAETEGVECGACLAEPPVFDRLRAAVAYGDLARAVALKLKYGRKPGVARTMAALMLRHVDAAADPLLCPVPLHRWRIWRRGYNQSALVAAAIGRRLSLDVRQDLLLRTRATPPLKGMSPHQRRQTVRGAFCINPRRAGEVKGRNILLIDDVFTTGATASACARLLKRAGAAEVAVLCWARVLREGED